MLEKNLVVLRERFPKVAVCVESAVADPDIRFGLSRNKLPNAEIMDPILGPRLLHSKVDPMRSAGRDVEALKPEGDGAIAVLGFGLGYHLLAAAQRFPGRRLIAIESRAALLRRNMELFDWSPLLAWPGFTLLGPGTAADDLPPELLDPAPARFANPALFKLDLKFYYPFWKRLSGAPAPGRRRRILSFMSRGHLIPHTLADTQETLREMGHDVRVADLTRVTTKYEFQSIVWKGVTDYCPDMVFTMDGVGLYDEIIGRLGIPIAAWFFDDPFGILNFDPTDDMPRAPLLGDDFIAFSWDKHYVRPLLERGVRAHYLPLCSNPRVYFPREGTAEERERYGADISFIGNPDRPDDSEYRLSHVRALDGRGVALWGGPGWKKLGPNFSYRGAADNRNEAPLIYSLSKINLNFTTSQLVTALPMRVFDVLACGGFLLTDHRADLDRLFEPGREMAVFHSMEEMREMADHYLSRPEERAEFGRRGLESVLARHTFRHRMETLMETVFGGEINQAIEK